MKARTPFDHLDRAYAHLTKAYSQLTRQADGVSACGRAARSGSVQVVLDATEVALKATGEARGVGRMASDAGLSDVGSKVGRLSQSARQHADEAHRCLVGDSRDQLRVRLRACIDALEQLRECDPGDLQAYYKRGRRLDELLAVFRAVAGVKQLLIAESGAVRPTAGDGVSLADEVVRTVMLLRRSIIQRPT